MKNLKFVFVSCLVLSASSFLPPAAGETAVINAFNAGELTPQIGARTDFSRYYSGCRTLENMLAEPWGDVSKRPGTYYITQVADTIPGTEGSDAIPGEQFRPEAVVVTSNTRVWILDADYTILNELSPGNDCMTLDIDDDGNIYFGVNNSGTTDSRIRRWDINGNWEPANFYTPTGGWPNSGSTVRALRLSPDGAYLYADLYSLTSGHPRLYKFDNTTGSDVWVNIGTSYWGMYVDADGLIYRPNGIYDEDGNLTQSFTKGTAGYGWDVYVDEANNRAYFAGQGGFAAIDTDDTNYSEKRLGSGKYGYSIKVLNEEVFGTGDRTQKGVGGAWANVYKYDTSLNITASYDTGSLDSNEPWHVWFDKDNQVIVRTDQDFYIFDTDLNLQNKVTAAMGTQAYRGEEGRAIKYITDETPAVEGTPDILRNTAAMISPVRLIGCVILEEDAYVIEMGDLYFRFLK